MGWLYQTCSKARHAAGVIFFGAIGFGDKFRSVVKCHKMEASKKVSIATRISVFDFEPFIGGLRQNKGN
jgi:hypothetical protein